MTTPRIEEMVEEFWSHTDNAEETEHWLRQALTETHQAGIDVGKTQALHLLEDLFSKAKDKAELIEMFNDALQDNK